MIDILCRTAFIRVCCKINLARFMKTGLAKILSFLSTSLVLACLLCCLVMSFLVVLRLGICLEVAVDRMSQISMAGCNNLVEVIVI